MDAEVLVTSVEAGSGLIFNLIFIFTLAHTWKQWRQVKHYLVFLTVGNMIDVTLTLGVHIGWLLLTNWDGSDLHCKLSMFVRGLGPFLTSMAVVALAVHVLLTSVTGNQGNRLRHGFLIGLFLVLSMPVPVTQIPMVEVRQNIWSDDTNCKHVTSFSSEEKRRVTYIVFYAILTLLPLGVIVVTLAASLTLNRCRGGCKGDTHHKDLILTGLLGFVLALCCVPFDGISLYTMAHPDRITTELGKSHWDLLFLVFAKPAINALVCVVFWYCFVKKRDEMVCFPLNGESLVVDQAGEAELQVEW